MLKIVELGSYTKAAEQLSLTQPAVSQHIRQLEESLNVKIFEHKHNKFQLTSEGEIVVKFARQMIALENNLEQALKNERGRTRSLTVGITHTAESSVIIEALVACTNQYEGLNLRILTNSANQLYAMLKNYELDFAFIEGRSGDPSLGYLLLDTDCLVLAVAPTHPLAQQSIVTIDRLRMEKLILRLPNSNTRKLFEAALNSQNLAIEDFNITLEIDSVASIKELVRRGFGVSVLAKSTCINEQRSKDICLLTIENLSMIRETNIVFRRSFEHTELLKEIVEKYNEM